MSSRKESIDGYEFSSQTHSVACLLQKSSFRLSYLSSSTKHRSIFTEIVISHGFGLLAVDLLQKSKARIASINGRFPSQKPKSALPCPVINGSSTYINTGLEKFNLDLSNAVTLMQAAQCKAVIHPFYDLVICWTVAAWYFSCCF